MEEEEEEEVVFMSSILHIRTKRSCICSLMSVSKFKPNQTKEWLIVLLIYYILATQYAWHTTHNTQRNMHIVPYNRLAGRMKTIIFCLPQQQQDSLQSRILPLKRR